MGYMMQLTGQVPFQTGYMAMVRFLALSLSEKQPVYAAISPTKATISTAAPIISSSNVNPGLCLARTTIINYIVSETSSDCKAYHRIFFLHLVIITDKIL